MKRISPARSIALLTGLLAAACLFALSANAPFAQAAARPELPAPAAKLADTDEHEGSRTCCAGCGVVETIRAIEGPSAEATSYEFTVRFRDGSTRTTTAVGKASWQVGDRIIVVGGAPAR